MSEVMNYIEQVDEKRKEAFLKLYQVIENNLPEGFEAVMQYGMPSFVVPLSKYPNGYLNREDEPLPFISIGVQKNHIALYHMGIYSNQDVKAWFEKAYEKQVPTKLNMGKSCIRFTNHKNIPFELIGELSTKITVEDWVYQYENTHRK